jgi:pseudouridine kinase
MDCGKTQVVAMGGANMDVSVSSKLPLLPHDSTPGEIHCNPGGVARNVAENLARLGVNVILISAVGNDLFGQRLTQATAQAGVNVDALHVLQGQRTASYMALHGPAGELTVAVNDMGILEALSPGLLQAHHALFRQADCIVLDCNLSAGSLAWVLQTDTVAPVFVDAVSVAKCTRLLPHLAQIHTLKVNRLEAQALTGRAVTSVDDALDASRHLHAMGVRNVVLSLGHDGACWCDASGNLGHEPARTVQVVNTNGAGDAMMAGLVQAHLAGKPLNEAVVWANACAQITLGSALANAPLLSTSAVQSLLIHHNTAQ